METRILLVDDHPMMCAGMRLVLHQVPGLVVVGQAHNGKEAFDLTHQLKPDLIVVDINLGDQNGLAVAEEILAQSPQILVIVFSALVDPQLVDRAVRAGVKGYLVKGDTEGELLQAIQVVIGGKSYLCSEATEALMASYRRLGQTGTSEPKPVLTDREREVLKLTAEGLRVKEIASRLGIGIKTVDTHRSNLFAKLDCSSVAELTRYAIREGIIAP